MIGRWLSRSIGATAVVLAASLASAQTPAASASDQARAAEMFERAQSEYDHGRFTEAVALLTELRKTHKEPVLLYNLGRAYEGLGDAKHAIEAYEQYLREDPEPRDRGAIEARLETLRSQEKARIEAEARLSAPPKKEAPVAESNTARVVAASAITIGGVIGAGTGIALGVIARSHRDAAAAEPAQTTAVERFDAARSLATAANVAIIAGSAVAAGGGAWLIVELSRRAPAARASMRVGPGFVTISGSF